MRIQLTAEGKSKRQNKTKKHYQFDYVNSSQIDKRNSESGRTIFPTSIILDISRENNVLNQMGKNAWSCKPSTESNQLS